LSNYLIGVKIIKEEEIDVARSVAPTIRL